MHIKYYQIFLITGGKFTFHAVGISQHGYTNQNQNQSVLIISKKFTFSSKKYLEKPFLLTGVHLYFDNTNN